VSSVCSGGEILLESDIGPAVRGDHDAAPLSVWLEDTLGLCRSPVSYAGRAPLRVLPRITQLGDPPLLKGHGLGAREPSTTPRLPTEGSLALREYRDGDDVRRVHWVRSLASRELIVRLPDEVPPDRPRVRLVLDTFFPEAPALESDAPCELLDALVKVWLSIARALSSQGTRVTLVAAIPREEGGTAIARRAFLPQAPGEARELGARVAWQSHVAVDELLTREATFVVTRGLLPRSLSDNVRWIVAIPPISVATPPSPTGAQHPFPMGSSENRWLRARRARAERTRAFYGQGRVVAAMRPDAPWPGSVAAFVNADGSLRLEAVPVQR
jgi:uncharacterized protein (DUF58 family)